MIRTRSFSPTLVALTLGVCAVLPCHDVRAEKKATKAECSAAYEKGQEQRTDGHLKSARDTLAVCAQDACPSFVKGECKQWLEEVTNDLSSVAIDAKDPKGEETTAVTVTIDGASYAASLDGKPVELDPGDHEFRFEMEGAQPIEKRLYLEKGVRAQALHLAFEALAGDKTPDVAATESGTPEVAPPANMEKLRPFAYVAGGVGAAGLIGFAVFGAMGKGKQSDLEKSCSPDCSQSDIDSVKSKFLLADVSLGVGIVGLGAGVALFFLSQPPRKAEPSEDARALKFDVKTSASSTFATISGRF